MVSFNRLLDIFFFKQKTAYEMRISDWSSDVCSSDLMSVSLDGFVADADGQKDWLFTAVPDVGGRKSFSERNRGKDLHGVSANGEIGRASCRERVCRYV